MGELQRDIGPRQRDAAEHVVAMRELGGVRLEKLASCRRIEVEVGHLDHGAGRQCGGRRIALAAVQAPGVCAAGLAAGDLHPCDGGDRSQRFAAKTHGGDPFEVVEGGDLAGRVARQRQRQIVLRDATTVVGDADLPHAAFGQLHVDVAAAGIQTVLQQLLQHRGRALDHLAGGDLVDEQFRELVNGRHGQCELYRGGNVGRLR